MNLRDRAVSGVLWSLFAHGGQQVFSFALSLALARLLVPEDFGLVGMILVFSGFATLFADLGLSAAIVQRRELTREHLDSAFWLNVATGTGLALAFVFAAPAIAGLYGRSSLAPLIRAISVSFVFAAFGAVQRAKLLRSMEFRRLVGIDLVGILGAGGLAVALALAGAGVWSLIAQSVAAVAITSALLWAGSDWRPTPTVDRAALRDLLSFGGNLTGFNALNYWVRNADDFLIGWRIGSAALGIYGRAYHIMLLPVSRVSSAIGQVMFPILARVQHDRERSRAVYLRTIGAIAFVTFPAMLGLLVVADDFVLGVLGPQWSDVTPILRVYCLVGMVQSLGATTGWIYQAQGRTDWMFRWAVVTSVITLAAFVAGLPWGALGVAIAYTIRTYLLTYFNFSIPGRLIGLRFTDVVRTVASTLTLSVVMAGVVASLDAVLAGDLPHLVALSAQTVTGVTIYGGLVLILRPRSFRDLREVAAEVLAKRRAATFLPLGSGSLKEAEERTVLP